MARRSSNSANGPRFMHDQDFEDETVLLLAEYGKQHGQVTTPPAPIDEIVEEHLKLAIEYRDLRAEFPEGDVLGAIWFNDKLIAIDQSLVPEDFPAMRGRYRFTLAHELGHWRLHRHLYLRRAGERSLLANTPARPDHVLRSHATDPKEVQANRFAACLLMPREMVKREWHQLRGNMDPIYLADLRANQSPNLSDEMLFEQAARPLAEKFEVSPFAMRIRLEGMKFLCRIRENMLF